MHLEALFQRSLFAFNIVNSCTESSNVSFMQMQLLLLGHICYSSILQLRVGLSRSGHSQIRPLSTCSCNCTTANRFIYHKSMRTTIERTTSPLSDPDLMRLYFTRYFTPHFINLIHHLAVCENSINRELRRS